MCKVSVIVPVYNCETYLPRCIDSILAQTEPSLELILVDDGSRDGSGGICDDYARKDPRVIVIHQNNQGVSHARNAGLEAAQGKFIGFVDADDFIEDDTYRTALDAIGSLDMVMWDAVTLFDDGSTQPDTIGGLPESCVLNKSEMNPTLLSEMAGAVWRCLYRSDLIHDLRFPVGIKLSEDRVFNMEAMGRAQKLSYLKKGMYIRFVRKGSAVYRYRSDVLDNSIAAMKVAKKVIDTHWGQEYLDVYIRMFLYNGALMSVYHVCSKEFPGKSRLKAIGEITAHPALKEAFQVCPPATLKEKWLYKQSKLPLLWAGQYFQWRHGR